VTSRARARRLERTAVPVLGYGEAHTHLTVSQAPDRASEGIARSGAAAFAAAGISAAEVSFAELYDCFTITVLATLEDLGFCPPGEAGWFAADGHLDPGGSLPVNTYGGMLSGATGGMYHLTEAVTQLRGEAGPRQVAARDLAAVTGVGGVFSACATVVLGAPGLGATGPGAGAGQ
jgi:acetyl-CoA acetyltransferase